jgi:phage-related protein (TIGR01555 family)
MKIPYTNINVGLFDIEIDSKPKASDVGGYDYDSITTGSVIRNEGTTFSTHTAKYRKYKNSGFAQNIVNAVADDATREGFEIDFPELNQKEVEKLNELLHDRLSKLEYKNRLRDAIKFSRIYEEGSGLFYSVIGSGNVIDESKKENPVDVGSIQEVSFINVLESPDYFSYEFDNISDPCRSDFLKPNFQIGQNKVDLSRVTWLVNEFNSQDQRGVSIIEKCWDAIASQQAGIDGASHVLERIGAVILKSPNATLSMSAVETIKKLVNAVKNNIKSSGAMAIGPADELTIQGFTFTGIKDIYDFVIDNLAGASGIPRSLIVGGQKGGIITGDGASFELMNYYTSIEQYQNNILEKEDRKLITYLLMEKQNTKIQGMTGGKLPKFVIEYNPLWSLSEKEASENRKRNAEADKMDLETGKAGSEELRSLDPRYAGIETPDRPMAGDEDDDDGEE